MTVSYLKKQLQDQLPVLGVWSVVPSPAVCEILAHSGLDFVILDMEHGPYTVETIAQCMSAISAHHISPLVRLSGRNLEAAQVVLDSGAHGLVLPQIQNAAEALWVTQACQYPPNGIRGFNPFTKAGRFGHPTDRFPSLQTNDFSVSCVIVETREAYADLDAILAIPELDVVYLGVYDMSVALGVAGQVNSPAIQDFLQKSIQKIRAAKKHAGVLVKSPEEMQRYLNMGANFLVYCVDSWVIFQAFSSAMQSFKELIKH